MNLAHCARNFLHNASKFILILIKTDAHDAFPVYDNVHIDVEIYMLNKMLKI